jgi:hypothetical protein
VTGGARVESLLQRSTFTFASDAAFEQRFWFTTDGAEQPAIYRSSYVQRARGSLDLEEGGGHGYFRGATLVRQLAPTLVCARSKWEAVPE